MRLPWLNLAAARQQRGIDASRAGSDDHSRKVLIYGEEAERIARLTIQYPDIETGGDLFGYWTHGGSPVIAYVIGPGAGCRHHVTSFYQDERYLHEVGTALYDGHGLQHVGAWHSHHRLGLNRPSAGDVDTVRSGMHGRGWSRFLLLITTFADDAGPVFQNYFLFEGQSAMPQPLRIHRLPGASPFRHHAADPREEPMRRTSAGSWQPGPSTPGAPQSADEKFPDAWFTTHHGKALLLRATRRLAAEGVQCRMVPGEDGRSLKLLLPDGALLLGRHFPDDEPRWLEPNPPQCGPWAPSTDLAEWYLRARHPPGSVPPAPRQERIDGHAGDDQTAE